MENLMAQKSKAAARQPRTLKQQSGKSSPVKTSAKSAANLTSKASKLVAAVKAAVAPKAQASKTLAKPAALPAKPVASAKAKPAVGKPAVAKPALKAPAAAAKPAKPEKRIEEAKAALKKENVQAQAPAKPAGAKTRSRKISVDANPGEAASALAAKWSTLYKKAEQIEAKPYNMKAVFEEKTAITHKVLGWGYILANRNDRLEVLFKDGIKYLISNYKP
jgi:hypothetical protein